MATTSVVDVVIMSMFQFENTRIKKCLSRMNQQLKLDAETNIDHIMYVVVLGPVVQKPVSLTLG